MTRRPSDITQAEVDEDSPITLKRACEVEFAGALTVSSLRAEWKRGNLEVYRIGKRQFTTLRKIREMRERCLDAPKGRGSISTRNGNNGLSEMDRISSARVALSETAKALKSGSQNTSRQSTARRQAQRH